MSGVSTEELLALLEKAQEEAINRTSKTVRGGKKEPRSVKRFIDEWDIDLGIDKVPGYMVYYYYRMKWKGIHTPDKINKIHFLRTFSKYFTSGRSNNVRYYLLDGTKFDLSREGKLEAKHYDERDRKRIKTVNQKKKNKIPKLEKRYEHKG